MATDKLIVLYGDLANQTWKRMVKLVGVHAVFILIQRAIWLTRQKYSEASQIELNETGISLHGLENADPGILKALLEEFFTSLISILTRLVGKDITRKMAKEIDRFLVAEDIEENTKEGA